MSAVEPPDCGDNSCLYASKKGGMRTNGGCRCSRNNPHAVDRYMLRLRAEREALIRALQAVLRDRVGPFHVRQDEAFASAALYDNLDRWIFDVSGPEVADAINVVAPILNAPTTPRTN